MRAVHARLFHRTGYLWAWPCLMAGVLLGAAAPLRAEVTADLTVMVPMSDGTHLATDVYLPKTGGPAWPVRLVRTPYGRVRYNNEYGRQADRGYAMVLQDMRGRFDSEGKALAFVDCGWGVHRDGLDTLKWIHAQPWCNGKVGTEGASAMGITQYMLGPVADGLVQAQYILVAAPSLYHHASYTGGGLTVGLTVGWLTGCNFPPDNIWTIASRPFYDAYWEQLDSIAHAAEVEVPAVHYGGWYDVFQQGTIDGFVSRQNHGGPGARGKQKLVIGPWGHGGPRNRPIGEILFPENNLRTPFACGGGEWFDYYLKGVDTGIDKVPAVQYYTMGAVGEAGAPGNVWKTADSWPVPASATSYYLHADKSLGLDAPQAADTSDTAGAAVEYDYNPLRPVPTHGGCLLGLPAGAFDQRDLDERPDVAAFTSAPLAAPVEVTGRVTARLEVVVDRLDTDFAVKLTDVYPDGRSINIVDGLARARYRKGYDHLALLTPGEPASIEVDCWSTSYVFNAGHRIRVSVTGSNYPHWDVNPNTGWPAWPMGPVLPAHHRILCSKGHPSRIILPVVQ